MKQAKKKIRVGGRSYTFQVSSLDHKLKDSPPPIPAVLGDSREVWEMYASEISAFQSVVGTEYAPVPFAFPRIGRQSYGDFTSSAGQRDLRLTRLFVKEEPLQLVRPMQEIRRFADLAQALRFPKSEDCACVRDLSLVDNAVAFTIGPGPYEEVFATMNSQGLVFGLTSEQLVVAEAFWQRKGRGELVSLARKLRTKYGSVTIRKATHEHCKGLPRFGARAVSYVLGGAAVVTTSDGYAVFGRRARKRVSLNTGVNVATSGGFKYDREKLEDLGFSRFAESEILREAREELGIQGNDCAVTILAFVRELSRAGSPEILARIEFFGTLRQLIGRMRENQHPEQDVDAVYAIPIADACRLVHESSVKILQPKAAAAVIMLDRSLRNGGC